MLKDKTKKILSKTSIPIKLTFTNLTYTVRVKSSQEQMKSLGVPKFRDEVILKEASGYMLPG